MNNILRNFNLFVDGTNYAGQIEEINLPKPTVKTEEHRVGGMDAPIALDMGMEALKADFTLTGFDPAVLRAFGLQPGRSTPLTARGALRNEDGTTTAVAVTMTGTLKMADPGTWKTGGKSPLKIEVDLRYYKLDHGGVTVHEIDVIGMKRVINGVDQLAEMRAALGL
jgi:P2 family phage contractile tail tube protein